MDYLYILLSMKRMRLKRKIKFGKLNFIFITIIIIIILSFKILNFFGKKAIPIFLNYSEIEVKRIASLLINNTLLNEISNNITIDDLFIIKEDDEGNIISMDVNSLSTNKLLIKTNTILEENFKYLENGEIEKLKMNNLNINTSKKGIIYELPSGIIFDNVFLNNLFPKIPVRMNLVGSIFSKIVTDLESYGINNAIFKVNIQVTVNLKIVLPFTSKDVELIASIPVIIKIIEGDIPNYYFQNQT